MPRLNGIKAASFGIYWWIKNSVSLLLFSPTHVETLLGFPSCARRMEDTVTEITIKDHVCICSGSIHKSDIFFFFFFNEMSDKIPTKGLPGRQRDRHPNASWWQGPPSYKSMSVLAERVNLYMLTDSFIPADQTGDA
jgi:hypothetical protein